MKKNDYEKNADKARSFMNSLITFSNNFLLDAKLKDGGVIKIGHISYSGWHVVDFFNVKGYMQNTLGNIVVRTVDLVFNGTYYQHPSVGNMIYHIEMKSKTPQEAVAKMASCLAPLIEPGTYLKR